MSEASETRGSVLAELRALGFCVIPDVVPAPKLASIAAAYDRAFDAATPPDLKTSSSGGDTRLIDFVNRGAEFDELYVLEPILSACLETLGPLFKLSSFHGRTVLPGAVAQGLHVDVSRDDDAWPLLGFIVMVDGFRSDNGATRFARGSHHAEPSTEIHAGNGRPDDGCSVLACGEPGSVIVYFGATWHGYSANRSTRPRRAIQGAYVPRHATAAVRWEARMKPETLARLTPAARYVLDVA